MSLSGDISRFKVNAAKAVENDVKAVKMALFSSIIKDTPVLTGRLAGNWQTGLGAAAGTVDRTGAGASIAEMKSSLGKAEDTIYMTNNLPYAERIEFAGYSAKSPEGMVRRNVVRVANLLRARGKV
jgi:hypothetical protein